MRRLGAAFGGASKILAQTPMVYQKRAKNTVLTVRAMNEQKTNTHVYEQKRTFRAPKKQKKNVPTRGERSAALTGRQARSLATLGVGVGVGAAT